MLLAAYVMIFCQSSLFIDSSDRTSRYPFTGFTVDYGYLQYSSNGRHDPAAWHSSTDPLTRRRIDHSYFRSSANSRISWSFALHISCRCYHFEARNPIVCAIAKRVDTLVRTVRENVTGARVIKALSKAEYEKQRFQRVNQSVVAAETKANRTMAATPPLMDFS